jgi:SAM-dependent methyltransferase
MKDSDQVKNWYRDVAATYTAEQRKNWYNDVADAYDRVRPHYLRDLVCRAVEVAHLPPEAAILEVGCGPGNATVTFADLGFSVIALEPSQAACQLAQRNCAQYPKVEIQTTTFEEWELEPEGFHAVLAANAWHWIPPELGYSKAAAALQPNGSLILLWNMTPQPPYEVYQALNQLYQTQALSLPRYEDQGMQAEILEGFGQNVIDSGYFTTLVSEQVACEVTYSINDYLMLLSTLASYRVLEPIKREAVFAGIRDLLEQSCGRSIQVSYLSAFHVAQKL